MDGVNGSVKQKIGNLQALGKMILMEAARTSEFCEKLSENEVDL